MHGIYKIPFFGLDRQYLNIREEILDVTDGVLRSGQVLDGAYTVRFEQSIAKMCQRKYAVAVGSGTSALEFAYRTIDYRYPSDQRDKIVIPGQSFVATLNSVYEAGFEPSFCDVDRLTGLLNPATIDESSESICAITAVNLFGNVVDFDRLNTYKQIYAEHDIVVVEDAAQSFGSYYNGIPSGKLGDISCLSFDPTKNLPCYGSGGMVLTDDEQTALMIADYRNNGKSGGHYVSGTNSKMSEVECAQMLIKLKYFEQWQARRQQIANYYIQQLDGIVKIPMIEDNVESSWHKFVVHVMDRYKFVSNINEEGIETKIHYGTPLHLQSLSFQNSTRHWVLDGSEEFAKTCVSLPIYPELTDMEVECIVDTVKNCV